MSIAISAIVRPSQRLRAAHALLCALMLVVGTLSPSPSGPLLQAAAVAGIGAGRGKVKAARIDISGGGQVRLTVYQCQDLSGPDDPAAAPGCAVRLLPGSTVWSALLLLRLAEVADDAHARRRVHWLAVLPDGAPGDVRRRLAVAVRSIAARAPEA